MSRSFRAFLDRFEGDLAVLLLGEEGEEQIVLPRSYLPPEAREGQVLRGTLEVDRQATEAALAELRDLM